MTKSLLQFSEEWIYFQQMVLEQLAIHMEKKDNSLLPHTIYKQLLKTQDGSQT